MTTNEEATAIKNIITRAVEQNPQNSEILKAFEPIIIMQRHLAAQSSSKKFGLFTYRQRKT